MPNLNLPVEELTSANLDTTTNNNYISPEGTKAEPPVLRSVFRAIVVETVKDFFGSIIGFFLRYIRHFIDGFRYFWTPTLKRPPFDTKDYKENCQHAFELTMIVLFAVIFMVKLEWIPPTESNMLEWLNNDLSQMGVQAMMFVFFAVTYFTMVLFSIFTGRLWRLLLRINISRKESDILFIYLNNTYFSIAAVVGLIVRSIVSLQTTDTDTLAQGLLVIFLPICLLLNTVWSIRFAMVNNMGWGRGIAFFLLTSSFYTIGFALGQLIAVSFLMNI